MSRSGVTSAARAGNAAIVTPASIDVTHRFIGPGAAKRSVGRLSAALPTMEWSGCAQGTGSALMSFARVT
jgi:hypothetical protein